MFHTLGRVKKAIGIGEDETGLRIETEKELAQDSHLIVVATEKGKEELIYFYNAPPEIISVIPCGVNLKLFKPINKQIAKQYLGLGGKSIILFVGRIEPLKGIDKLLMAMPCLKKEQGLRLVIIGGDDQSQFEMERLERVAQNLYIQDLVTFPVPVRQEEMPWFYSAADVCVIPSYYESFGLVALESLACGTPG